MKQVMFIAAIILTMVSCTKETKSETEQMTTPAQRYTISEVFIDDLAYLDEGYSVNIYTNGQYVYSGDLEFQSFVSPYVTTFSDVEIVLYTEWLAIDTIHVSLDTLGASELLYTNQLNKPAMIGFDIQE